MLNDAIGDLLPSAIAVALSPIPIVAVVVVLGAPRARTAGPAFALGWIAGLLSVSVIVVLLLGSGSDPDSDDPGLNWLKIAIGVLFLLMAAKQWTKRPRRGEEPETPSWMATVDTATPPRAALLGAALSGANPKNLTVLALPALRHEDDPEAVRILERQPVRGPVGVGGRDRSDAEARGDRLHGLVVADVEHEQRFGMRRRGAVPAARRQLEVRAGARHREEHAVVAVVIAEAADLGQPDAVPVERDDLVEALGVPGHAQLHRSAYAPPAPAAAVSPSGSASAPELPVRIATPGGGYGGM